MAQNDKTLCPLHFISQEPYIIWSWFMVVHLCKGIISPGVFYILFQILIFGVNSGVKEQKGSNMSKNYVCCTPYLSKDTSYDCVFCCRSLKWWHFKMLFSFFQNFGGKEGGGVKGQKMAQNVKKILSNSVSQELYFI